MESSGYPGSPLRASHSPRPARAGPAQPPSKSAFTGTLTQAASSSRRCASVSSGCADADVRRPHAPNVHAKPALVVARALKPSCSKALALPHIPRIGHHEASRSRAGGGRR